MRHMQLKKELERAIPELDSVIRLEFIIDCLTMLKITSRPEGGGEYVIPGQKRVPASVIVAIPETLLFRGTHKPLHDFVVGNIRQSMTHMLVHYGAYLETTLYSNRAGPGPKVCDLDWEFEIELQGIRCSRVSKDAALTQALTDRLLGKVPEKVV
jgi:hypothetical protein